MDQKIHHLVKDPDKFQVEVAHSVEFVSSHRADVVKYGSIALALVIVVAGFFYWRNAKHEERQVALHEAMRMQDAQIGPGETNDAFVFFPSEEKKTAEVKKAFGDIISKYPGSDEAIISRYYLATNAADKGDLAGAEKSFREVSESSEANYASLAKLALAQIYESQGKIGEGEKLLRSLVDKPTEFVSKESATIALGRLISATKPDEARKLLEPLRGERSAVSRAALTALAELAQKQVK